MVASFSWIILSFSRVSRFNWSICCRNASISSTCCRDWSFNSKLACGRFLDASSCISCTFSFLFGDSLLFVIKEIKSVYLLPSLPISCSVHIAPLLSKMAAISIYSLLMAIYSAPYLYPLCHLFHPFIYYVKWNIHTSCWLEWVYLLLFPNHELKVQCSYFLVNGMSWHSQSWRKVKCSYSLMDGMSLFAPLSKSWIESEIFILSDGWNEFICFSFPSESEMFILTDGWNEFFCFSFQIMNRKWNVHTDWWMEWVYLFLFSIMK